MDEFNQSQRAGRTDVTDAMATVEEYGSRHQAEYGGSFLEAGVIIALFKDNVEVHRDAIEAIVPRELTIHVRSCSSTLNDLRRSAMHVRKARSSGGEYQVLNTTISPVGDALGVWVWVSGSAEAARTALTSILGDVPTKYVTVAEVSRTASTG